MSIENKEPMGFRNFGGCPADFKDTAFLITGGTGSFGQRFVRYLLDRQSPKRLVVYSRDELKQYEMERELREAGYDMSALRFFLGDVRDQPRLEMALNGIDTVVHAAALKQVPSAEYNPFECIHTNVLGAENIVRASLRTNVTRVVALSTDKACSPVNLYGASKLASDKIFVAANNLSGGSGPRFAVVRYGNVMGSRGSVIPLFRKLIESGSDNLPITDKRMTRFWITLEQGVSFVLSCLRVAEGGEIFIPKIPSTKVTDLALAMAPDLKHRFVGIRPGEKLHESMITSDDARSTVELDDRYIIKPQRYGHSEFICDESSLERPVAEGFHYSSNTNTEWLDVDQIREWLNYA